MLNVRLIRAILLFLLVLSIVGLTGCSVFSTVGGWISQGYENTVAYFNAYYNAKRLFDDAEAEVLAAEVAAKGKAAQPGVIAPIAVPKQKFTTVIDKCSNILAFSPSSNVVDDALFLIGKSFFYMEDYVKAERKFTELVARYPNGPLALDGELWLLKTLQHLNRFDDATGVGQNLVEAASAAGENEIAADALSTLGDIAAARAKNDLALEEYHKAVAQSDDDKKKAEFVLKSADLYFALEEYEKAAGAYLDIASYSPSDYSSYYSQLQAAVCYRSMRDYDRALTILATMESDYRYFDYRGAIRLERAETFSQSGKLGEAVVAYKLVDSLYNRTEVGARGAFRLGDLLQYELGDYAGAKLAYSRASSAGPPDAIAAAQKISSALDRYFALWREYSKADSVLSIYDIDSLWIARDSTGAPLLAERVPDTARAMNVVSKTDTGKQKPDTSLSSIVRGAVPAESKGGYRLLTRPDRATLAASRALSSYQLGELFHSDLDAPDSTYFWLNRALHFELDSVKAPRALYLMAGIAHADSLKRFGDPRDLYRFIVARYPKSTLAEESRVALGFPPTIKTAILARERFFVAESLSLSGRYQSALDSLSALVKDASDTTLVPKSLYTMAWIYEHDLKKPDSALARYRMLATRYASTVYGAAAIRRIPPPPEPPPPDSTKGKGAGSAKGKPPNGAPSSADSTLKAAASSSVKVLSDTAALNPSPRSMVPDSTGLSTVLRKAPGDTTKKKLDVDELMRTPAPRDSTRSRRAKETREKQ